MDFVMDNKLSNKIQYVTESLIKFVKLVLTEIGGDPFSDFPNSLKNLLSIKNQFQSFVPCTKCHKFYQKDKVESYRQHEILTIMKYKYVEFLNLLEVVFVIHLYHDKKMCRIKL